ncbi:MAG: 4-hydroxybenzoate octaprenyltransferase [Chlamydiales bacterium]
MFTAWKSLTRIEQTFFGLPFLLAGVLLPMQELNAKFSLYWLWILPAFMCARISGMAFNQLIDRHIDAKNPRTKERILPSKGMKEKVAWKIAWGSLILFFMICLQINEYCFLMAFVIAFLLFIYSYLKRFTSFCHVVLGVIHFLVPVMSSVAISGDVLISSFFLGGVAFGLIVGSDIIYAIQDYQFDCDHHLFSIPSRLGLKKSQSIARLLHGFSLIMLVGLGITAHFPLFYYWVIGITGCVFYIFHKKIEKKNSEKIFFFLTVSVGSTVFIFVLVSVLWAVM